MTRNPKPRNIKKEARMQKALKACTKRRKRNIAKATAAHRVPHTTLNHWVNGRKSHQESLQSRQALSSAEESKLIR